MAKHLFKTALELKKAVAQAAEQARLEGLSNPGVRKRVNDGGGLRVEVTRTASTTWQQVYRMPGKTVPKTFTLGDYPTLGLSVARELGDKVMVKVAQGIDPNEEKQALRAGASSVEQPSGDSLNKVLDAFIEECRRKKLSQRSITTVRRAFDFNVTGELGGQVAKTITPEQIEKILRKVEARNAFETVRRLAGWLKQAFNAANITPNPAQAVDLSRFKPPIKSHEGHPGTTDPRVFAQILRSIDGYAGAPLSRAAILLHARTFVRPDELRLADWYQVQGDFFHAEVILTNATMEHMVPLSTQSQALFAAIRPIHPEFVLPGHKYGQRMSDSTLGSIMHMLGWKNVQTVHGFRKTASTLLNEMGWLPRHVDMQLSHKLTGKGSEGVYNKAKYLEQRIPMMQCWSDYIDALLDPASGADAMLPMRWRQRWLREHPPIPEDENERFGMA